MSILVKMIGMVRGDSASEYFSPGYLWFEVEQIATEGFFCIFEFSIV